MKKIAIVIPCYNEGKRLVPDEFLHFLKTNEDVTFVMVNDGSTDNTPEIINNIHRANKRQVVCVHLKINRGKAEAVRQGFVKAFSMGCGIVGFWDADLATPLYEINNLYKCLEEIPLEMVFGSRVCILGKHIERKASRHYFGRIIATAISLILGVKIYDSQCGAKLFRNTKELRAVFKEPFWVNWTFDVEIIARFIVINKTLRRQSFESTAVEYPLHEWRDISGSKVKCIDFFIAIMDLGRIIYFLYAPYWERRALKLLEED